MTTRNKILFASIAGICAIAVIIVAVRRGNNIISPGVSTISSTLSVSSTMETIAVSATSTGSKTVRPAVQPKTQEQVDTTLSPLPPTKTSSTTAVVPNGCVLDLAFDETSGNFGAASTMRYTLSAKNLGDIVCQSASISVYYANNETFVSATPPAAADGYYWVLGNLAPGSEIDIALTTERSAPLSTGDVTDEACLSANNGSDACSNSASGQTLAQTAGATSANASQEAVETPSVATTTLAPGPGKELGVWVWTPISQMSVATMQQTVDEAAENNFNAIYITVDEYLSIAPQGQDAIAGYEDDVANFIALAAQKNIAVDAEAGSQNWGQPGDTTEAPAIVSFVAGYNQSHAQKFRGVQFDIEPYLLPDYASNETAVLTNYVDLVSQLGVQAASDHIPLTIVVPHFFDDSVKWTPEITIDGSTNYTDNQLFAILGQAPGNRMIVMAYRNFADGADGSIALSDTVVDEADSANVRIIVAQETGPVTPSYVTFNNTSRGALATQAATIGSAYANDASFGGIAVDYLDPFLKLPE